MNPPFIFYFNELKECNMFEFLIFYYCFSVLFMIGYVDFDELNGFWYWVLGIICLLIFAPLIFPFDLGAAVSKIYK